ncbi:MAG TPA: hypothetical protein VIN40_00565 [Candidatus Tyrphobacter sp.]
MRFVLGLLAIFGLLCILYLAGTAYLGYRVGAAIHQEEQHAVIRTGAHLVGRQEAERYAVKRSGIPGYLTESPTFWLELHRAE